MFAAYFLLIQVCKTFQSTDLTVIVGLSLRCKQRFKLIKDSLAVIVSSVLRDFNFALLCNYMPMNIQTSETFFSTSDVVVKT